MQRILGCSLLAGACLLACGCGQGDTSKEGAIPVEQEQAEFESMHEENMRQGGALPADAN